MPNILIADDDRNFVNAIAQRCNTLGLETEVSYDATEALTLACQHRPDVICLDVNMPTGSGLSVCELIVNNDELADIPVIMLTGNKDIATIQRCHHLAAYYVWKHPGVWNDLAALLDELLDLPGVDQAGRSNGPTTDAGRSGQAERRILRTDTAIDLLSQPPQQLVDGMFEMLETTATRSQEGTERAADEPPWVLMIEDDRDFSWALKLRLESHGVSIVRAFEGAEGVQSAFAYPADAILLDFELPNGQGDHVLWRLKDHSLTKEIPVIMLTGRNEKFLERRIMAMGAAAFLTKPVNMAKLLEELSNHMPIVPWGGNLAPA